MYEELDEELRRMDENEEDAPTLVKAVHLADPISTLGLQPLSVVTPETTLKDALALMETNRVGCLLVEQDKRLKGIFTERDIIRRTLGHGLDFTKTTVGEYMTSDPDTLDMDAPIAYALNRMYDRGYRHIPIVDGNKKPVGFVSMRDIVNHLAAYYQEEVMNLPPRPVKHAASREGG